MFYLEKIYTLWFQIFEFFVSCQYIFWRRQWQPTPVFLPGKSHGRKRLVGCSPWGRTESDTTEVTQQQQYILSTQSIFISLSLQTPDVFSSSSIYIQRIKFANCVFLNLLISLIFGACQFSCMRELFLKSPAKVVIHLYFLSGFFFVFFLMYFEAMLDTQWTSLVAQMVKCLPAMQETQVRSLSPEKPLKKEMATHSSSLAWKIPWMEEPGGLQSMGSQRVRHN